MGHALVEFFGRTHPMVLHMPIGLLAALVALEGVALARRQALNPGVRTSLVWLAAIAAVVTAGSGWVLSNEPFEGTYLEWHRWLGIATASCTVMAALLLRFSRSPRPYAAMLVVSLLVLIPAGHLGSTLTHGEDFLFEPFRAGGVRAARVSGGGAPNLALGGGSTFDTVVAPILTARCASCHSDSKHKGGLVLASREGITKGGKSGPVLMAGKPELSEMIQRLRLEIDEEDHMPPKGKRQPTEQEIAALEAWIRAGAPFEGNIDVGSALQVRADSEEGTAPAPAREDATPAGSRGRVLPPAATQAALDALKAAHIHVAAISTGLPLLLVDFAGASAATTDEQAAALLEGVRLQACDVSLARLAIGSGTLDVLARADNLVRLNLSGCPVNAELLKALAAHGSLEDLIMTRTALTDEAAATLAGMPNLKRVYLWKSGLSEDAVARLRADQPLVDVNTGEPPTKEPLESEGTLTFSGERPLPGAAAAPAATTVAPAVLAAGNTVCPVSGKPIDPRYVVLHEGKLIGFCCEKCAAEFWAEPSKYPIK